MWGKADDLRLTVLMGLRKGLSLVHGTAPLAVRGRAAQGRDRDRGAPGAEQLEN
jgi:hypothetical protein